MKKLLAVLILLAAPFAAAQYTGIATVVGGTTPNNQFANTVATGLAGVVTNPGAALVVQVSGGQVYFGGSIENIAQDTLTLPASSTSLVVYNGITNQLYAKQAVTAAGSSGTTVGVPTALLFAIPNVEVPLSTVVCSATACGNGSGSITDARPLANFPAGLYVSGHLNTALANKDIAGIVTLAANAATVTFANAFQATPICVVTDQTTPQLVKAAPTTTNVVITDTVGATDVVSYICMGNPN